MPSVIAHKFHGSRIALAAAYAAGIAITGITKAKPAVVTSTAHGVATGDVVKIAGALGMTEANGIYIAKMLTANTYELVGSDSTGWGTYTSGGTGAKATFGAWCQVDNFQHQSGSTPEIDISSVCSDSQEIELGLPSAGSVTFGTSWAPDSAMQIAIDASAKSLDLLPVQYQPKGAKTQTTLLGFVQQTAVQAQRGGVWTGNVTYRVTGDPLRVLLP